MNILIDLLKVGGVTALSIGVLFLIYKQLLALNIFPKLTREQAFRLLRLMVILVFIVVALAFFATGNLSFNRADVSNSNGVTVIQDPQ